MKNRHHSFPSMVKVELNDLMDDKTSTSADNLIKTISKRVKPHEYRRDVEFILQQIRPLWKSDEIEIKELTGGITNKLLSCFYTNPDDIVLIRIFGSKTDLFIDRELEKKSMQSLSVIGCGPEVYASFENGLCYRFMKGIDLDLTLVIKENIIRLIAQQMVKMHLVDLSDFCPRVPCLFSKLETFLSLIPDGYLNGTNNYCVHPELPSRAVLENEVRCLETHLSKLDSPVVFCHNDLLLKNILYNQESNSVMFIDFEYANYNYQAFDIGNHFCEFAGVDTVDYSLYPEPEFQRRWLKIFLKFWFESQGRDSEPTDDDVAVLFVQVNKFALAAHLLWGLWSIVQSIHSTISFDYAEYAGIRLAEYFKRKKQFLSLEMPAT